MRSTGTQPWYREPWPWILMAGPAVVVVAGLVTAWLAVRGEDGLVADDYYKQGLAINQTIVRGAEAVRLGAQAELQFAGDRIRVTLANAGVRGALTLRLVHPTRIGMDQSLNLAEVQPGVYEGLLQDLQPGRWHMVLEDRDWRLTSDWTVPAAGVLRMGVRSPAPAGAGKSEEGRQ
jgi:uncharacterized protein